MQSDQPLSASNECSEENDEASSAHSSVVRFSVHPIDEAAIGTEGASSDVNGTGDSRCRSLVQPSRSTQGLQPNWFNQSERGNLLHSHDTVPFRCAGKVKAPTSFRHYHTESNYGDGGSHSQGAALVDLIDNPEYIDTLEGRLPLAAAAKMIARDSVVAAIGSGIVTPASTRRDCYTKLLALSFAVMLVSSAFFACQHVRVSESVAAGRSLNTQALMGSWSTAWLGSLVSYPLMHRLSPKWTIVVAMPPFLVYTAASFYPASGASLLPAALIQGFAGGILWSAEGTYSVSLASIYAAMFSAPFHEAYSKFNGVFCVLFQLSRAVGGVIAVFILDQPRSSATNARMDDVSSLDKSLSVNGGACGVHYDLLAEDGGNLSANSNAYDVLLPSDRHMALAILCLFVVSGTLTAALFLRSLDIAYLAGGRGLWQSLRSFASVLLDYRLLLLLPYAIALGLCSSVAYGDYSEGYVACGHGISTVGYAFLLGAIFGVIGSCLSIAISQRLGRMVVMCAGTAIAFGFIAMLQFWTPDSSSLLVVVFLPGALWFLSDGLLSSLLNDTIGALFKEQLPSACTAFLMCYGLSAVLGSVGILHLWTTLITKLYIAMGSLVLALACYVVLEVQLRRRGRGAM